MKIIHRWGGQDLWGRSDKHGLSLDNSGLWYVTDLSGRIGFGYTKSYLLAADKEWAVAFIKIEEGHKPSWSNCTCGASSIMGLSWPAHNSTCESIVLSSPFEPKNNDGRDYCYKCGENTKQAGGGQYLICKNKDCNWYEK